MDTEKVLHGSTEPLVLRPPVGSEVYGGPNLQFRPLSHTETSHWRHNRRRLLLLYLLCILTTLAIVSGLLFAMFVLSFGPFASSSAHGHSRQSMCRVFSPLLRTSWTESMSAADDTMLNITLSNMPQSQTYWILHLCTEYLTVIRTNDRCFIRPMRAEMVQACNRGYLKLVHDGHNLPDSVEAKIKDEYWFTEPPSSTPKVIRNSLIMAWCKGVPAFRLVSRPPTPTGFLTESENTYGNDPAQPPVPGALDEDDAIAPAKDPDSQEVFDQLFRQDEASKDRRLVSHGSDGLARHRRSIDLAQQMGIQQDQLPIYYAQQPKQCGTVDILEDATVSPNTPSGEVVPVVHDHITIC